MNDVVEGIVNKSVNLATEDSDVPVTVEKLNKKTVC